LVRTELKNNKETFKNLENIIKNDSYVCKKIVEAKGDWSTIPIDTLKEYRATITSISYSQFISSSWQIFQNSEIIQKMSDKELVIRLASCYYWINQIKELFEKQYWDKKDKAIVFERDPKKFFDAVMLDKETLYLYETMSSNDTSFDEVFFFIHTHIDYTLMLLDKNGNYSYDSVEKNNQFNTFFKARRDSVFHKKDTIQIKNENQ